MFKEKFAKLIDVKTILTFSLIGTMIYLAVIGKIPAEYIVGLGTTIVGFYFGTKKAQADASTGA